MSIIIGIILALIVAGIVVGIMWSSLISVTKEDRADAYVKKDSVKFDVEKDNFLYSKTEQKERPKENQS